MWHVDWVPNLPKRCKGESQVKSPWNLPQSHYNSIINYNYNFGCMQMPNSILTANHLSFSHCCCICTPTIDTCMCVSTSLHVTTGYIIHPWLQADVHAEICDQGYNIVFSQLTKTLSVIYCSIIKIFF